MAGRTVIDDAGVIEGRWCERRRVVADAAILAGRQVIVRLGRGKTGVVAGRAVVLDPCVIEGAGEEAGGHMTVAAVGIGRHMVVALACCGAAVVTGRAVARDARMVEVRTGKRGRRVAGRTVLGDRNMGWVDLRGGAGGIGTVVAGRAVAGDTGVVEHGRGEGATRYVADSTVLAGHHVIGYGVLAGCGGAVVARIATPSDDIRTAVVDKGICEIGGVVAHRTITGRVLVYGCCRIAQCALSGVS